MLITINCPICGTSCQTLNRYPNRVCPNCLVKYNTCDEMGEIISYHNTSLEGGIIAEKNGVEVNEYTCFVNGHKCYVQEGRFGGIVVQKF